MASITIRDLDDEGQDLRVGVDLWRPPLRFRVELLSSWGDNQYVGHHLDDEKTPCALGSMLKHSWMGRHRS